MWRIVLHGRDIVDGRLQAWIERDARRRYQSHFLRSQATARFTTNTICNCLRAIAVGAYDTTRPDRPATIFSSRGPTADGRQKPEIVAPGYMIRAARSRPRNGWQGNESRLCVKSGTSMAAPWVSGTVALMMQAAGRPLTAFEIRRALVGSADPTPGPSGRSSSKLGFGYLNTAAAVAAARRLVRSEQLAETSAEEAPSEELPPTETAAEEVGWPPVWIEDIAFGRFASEVVQPAESPEPCGCSGRREAPESEAAATLDEWETDEDEDTELNDEQAAPEPIGAPFGWEDVRDALDVIEDLEEPA
jgi:hypothetical protein